MFKKLKQLLGISSNRNNKKVDSVSKNKELELLTNEVKDLLIDSVRKNSRILSKFNVKENKKPQYLNISEIKKNATQIKNKDGYLVAVDYIKNFIVSDKIDIKGLVSLIKKVIPYMKKEETIDDLEITNFVTAQIERFSEQKDIFYKTSFAELLRRVDNHKAIEYMESILNKAGKKKSIDYFNLLIKLSECYSDTKQSNKAFQAIRRAKYLTANFTDKFTFLLQQRTLASKSAEICLKWQNKPKYAEYLYHEITGFIYEIAGDVSGFPHLSRFFSRKIICFNDGWNFKDNEVFDNALKHLNIFTYKKEIMNDIYDFAFNELPIKMGVPENYLSENLFDEYDMATPEWRAIMTFHDKFKKTPFDIPIATEFSNSLIKKYYDKENIS